MVHGHSHDYQKDGTAMKHKLPDAQVDYCHVNKDPPSYVSVRLWGKLEDLLDCTEAELGNMVGSALREEMLVRQADTTPEQDAQDVPF